MLRIRLWNNLRAAPVRAEGVTALKPWLRRTLLATVILLAVALTFDLSRGLGLTRTEARDFSARTLSGESWSLGEHLGKRPVLVSFFATY